MIVKAMCEIGVDFSGSANNKLNVVTCVGLICAYKFKDASATPVIQPMACHCNNSNLRKSHNYIVEREMSYVITVHITDENVMLFSLYKIFVGRGCSTPTNHSHEPSQLFFDMISDNI